VDDDLDGCGDENDWDCDNVETNCADGLDDDCNGFMDGDDASCGGPDPCSGGGA
jgi:hypothetical protein